MYQNNLFIIWFLVIVFLIIYTQSTTEGYIPFYNFKKYCGGCGFFNREDCSTCTNCGYCTTIDGNSECVPGDNFGPYFRRDCANWEYTDPYRRNPRTHKYPNIRNLDVYPYYSWGNLRRGQWGFRNRWSPGHYYDLRRTARFNRRLRNRIKASTI